MRTCRRIPADPPQGGSVIPGPRELLVVRNTSERRRRAAGSGRSSAFPQPARRHSCSARRHPGRAFPTGCQDPVEALARRISVHSPMRRRPIPPGFRAPGPLPATTVSRGSFSRFRRPSIAPRRRRILAATPFSETVPGSGMTDTAGASRLAVRARQVSVAPVQSGGDGRLGVRRTGDPAPRRGRLESPGDRSRPVHPAALRRHGAAAPARPRGRVRPRPAPQAAHPPDGNGLLPGGFPGSFRNGRGPGNDLERRLDHRGGGGCPRHRPLLEDQHSLGRSGRRECSS